MTQTLYSVLTKKNEQWWMTIFPKTTTRVTPLNHFTPQRELDRNWWIYIPTTSTKTANGNTGDFSDSLYSTKRTWQKLMNIYTCNIHKNGTRQHEWLLWFTLNFTVKRLMDIYTWNMHKNGLNINRWNHNLLLLIIDTNDTNDHFVQHMLISVINF